MTTRTALRDEPQPGADSNAKRAAKVADLIIEDVMVLGWPVGEVLGSETDLLDRYQVSRAVFREAVRLVEHQQVARTRRGPGGGLVITEPTVGAVVDAVVLYLYRVAARLDEIFEARIILEVLACQLASERTDESDLAELRCFVDEAPADRDGDPASCTRWWPSSAAIRASNSSSMSSTGWHSSIRRTGSGLAVPSQRRGHHAHARIAEALMAGDAGLAQKRMRKHRETEAELFRRRRPTRQLLPDSVVLAQSVGGKGAETVARNITQIIVTQGLRPGELVGTEPELIEREGVSRALLREAVRLLEHHQIARMRRGPGGGLFVMAPSACAVTEVVALYLARRGMRLAELAELRTGVEVAIADLAAERIDDVGALGLQEALVREEHATEEEQAELIQGLHAAVAAAAQNRVLQLVALVLIRLSRLNEIERLAPKARTQIQAEVRCTHEGIASAVEAGDRELARHRMRRHLEALGALMRESAP